MVRWRRFFLLFFFFWLNTSWMRRMNVFFLPPPGFYCNATTDEIGTCWPRSSAGRIVERPCPEYINGVKYNTTSKNWNSNKSFNVGGRKVPEHVRFQIKKILIYDFCQREVLQLSRESAVYSSLLLCWLFSLALCSQMRVKHVDPSYH